MLGNRVSNSKNFFYWILVHAIAIWHAQSIPQTDIIIVRKTNRKNAAEKDNKENSAQKTNGLISKEYTLPRYFFWYCRLAKLKLKWKYCEFNSKINTSIRFPFDTNLFVFCAEFVHFFRWMFSIGLSHNNKIYVFGILWACHMWKCARACVCILFP